MNNGVREILPFIRYIAQFIDFEFKYIQGQDRGQGVVCAATWYVRSISRQFFDIFTFGRIMPAAMVSRGSNRDEENPSQTLT